MGPAMTARMLKAVSGVALLATLLTGCAGMVPPSPRAEVIAEEPPMSRMPQSRGSSGGVFTPESGLSLTSDARGLRVGDVVTVTLEETTQASKKAATTFSKNSDVTVDPLTLRGKSLATNIGMSATRDFDGNSTSTQQNALTGAITVVVQEVLPNGLLRVAGEKMLVLNQGEEYVRLRGYLRSADIDSNNQVSSLRIANARIAYSGMGTLADATAPGWLTRFFTGPWMPF
jgi:flagellar L-ring protein precursor FlgH